MRFLRITYMESGKVHTEERGPYEGTRNEALDMAEIELRRFNSSLPRKQMPERHLIALEIVDRDGNPIPQPEEPKR